MRIFGANELRSAILEHLARQAGGVTSGQIATSLEAAYQTVFRHLQSLEAEGVVVSDAGPTRHGQRVRYSLDADARDRALADYRAYLDGDL
jgi:predicted ArsR family transcriptional regulator